ncbi:MAG: histidine--tRNA ligase [Candidatus Cloacimonetes bacterium]|nr:histidine--tRNA ligase [Candidatus Cloacimonadota bacterium]
MAGKFSIPRGTFDVLPKDSYKWELIESKFRQIAKRFGYKEIVTPIFENSEVFERSVGDTSDIVQKEMYKFTDKKGRTFALRPEGTAPVIRSYVENNLGADNPISKLMYIGPMFRYDRPQAGRSRQFSQFGVECIGSNHPYYDAEVIQVFYVFLKEIGLSNFSVEINSIGCSTCTETYNDALRAYFSPHIEEMCEDCKNRISKNPKRLLDCKVNTCKKIADNAPSMLDYLDDECKSHFSQVQEYLKKMQIPFIVNPRIVRGLDYYTNTAFEFINNNLGAQNALGGGGRYNGLVEQFGGKSTPGIGFAGGITRLILSMEQENLMANLEPKPDIYFIALGDAVMTKAVEMISWMRQNFLSVEFDIEKTSMKAQMKQANRVNARFAIILGEDELNRNVYIQKDLQTGEQKELSLDVFKEVISSV